MKDNTIEIRDDDIHVEEIMEKIRENIRRRKASGELSPGSDSVGSSSRKNCRSSELDDAIQRDLSYINTNWDIHNNSYFISSHHPHIGKFLVKGRQLVHGEVRRYVDPMVYKQSRLNTSTVRVLNSLTQEIENIEKSISDLKNANEKAISDLESEMEKKIRDEVLQAVSVFNTDIERKTWLAHILEDRIRTVKMNTLPAENPSSVIKLNYLSFANRFRGSCDEIKHRQEEFLPYFRNCSHVLDIGCGRGEFLEILIGHKIGATGVDLDPDMVNYCKSLHLDVEMEDAILYLERLDDQSLDGIFIDQVVEHLEPNYLVRLLDLCYQKLTQDHYLVVETVNPLSLFSLLNFYLDMTHQKPVHPHTLKYLLESCQFREIDLKYYSEIPENAKLRKVPRSDSCNEREQEFLDNYNSNIDMLNLLLWGPRDYAVMGKK